MRFVLFLLCFTVACERDDAVGGVEQIGHDPEDTADEAPLNRLLGAFDYKLAVGDYWGDSDAAPATKMWLRSMDASSFAYWQQYAAEVDTCGGGTAPDVATPPDDQDEAAVISRQDSNVSARIPVAETGAGWWLDDVRDNVYAPEAIYDLDFLHLDGEEPISVPDVMHMGEEFRVTAPNLYGETPESVGPDGFTVGWTGESDLPMLLVLALRDTDHETTLEIQRCAATDDGEFTIPPNLFTVWEPGMMIDFYVGRYDVGAGVVPGTNERVEMAGAWWVEGALYAEE